MCQPVTTTSFTPGIGEGSHPGEEDSATPAARPAARTRHLVASPFYPETLPDPGSHQYHLRLRASLQWAPGCLHSENLGLIRQAVGLGALFVHLFQFSILVNKCSREEGRDLTKLPLLLPRDWRPFNPSGLGTRPSRRRRADYALHFVLRTRE